MTGALSGIRAVEFTSFTAGPLCGELLAQLGAEVIKIEPPDGDNLRKLGNRIDDSSYLYHLNNAGKRSVVADIRSAAGCAFALDIIKSADVVIENFAPGVLKARGLDYEAASKVNPQIVYCSVNGFGSSGPLSNERAYDVVVQGLCGLISLSGEKGGRAVKIGPSVVDMMGAAVASSAITAALYHRRRTGKGQRIDLAMYDIGAWLTSEVWPLALNGVATLPLGNQHRFDWPQNTYDAQDGLLAVAVETAEQRTALSRILGVAPPTDGWSRGDAKWLDRALTDWARNKTCGDAVAICQASGVPAAPVLELDAVVKQAHLQARGMLVEVAGRDAMALMFGSPFKMSVTPGQVSSLAEPVGASTDTIRAELQPHDTSRKIRSE
jgi:crotonobetainyl-CoA:carnitine CoA-transferase CaiB-like acyl-CoA transferase